MKVGVTGAAGFIGSHVCERLLAGGYTVVGVDDLSYGSVENLATFAEKPGFEFEVLDCTDRPALREAFAGCGAIMHLAAKKIPRYESALSTLEVNLDKFLSAVKRGRERLHERSQETVVAGVGPRDLSPHEPEDDNSYL